jgi:hypothetical protein
MMVSLTSLRSLVSIWRDRMASSGTGNSHDADYRKCQKLFYYKHRHGYDLKGTSTAPPLLVGEAIHKYCEVFINYWMEAPNPDFNVIIEEAMAAFNSIMGNPDPDNVDMLERENLARAVLPLWAARKWQKLESGLEIPLATELQLQIDLPADTEYGPIHPTLRKYTAKLDYVYQERDTQYVVISDHKGTKTMAPAKEVKHYLQSDQHLGYAACWNVSPFATKFAPCAKIEYDLTRLHPKVISEHTFHQEPRNINDEMLDDWYTRMLALRADMTMRWDKPKEVWIMNTTPHGPCLGMDGRSCEFLKLCQRPQDEQALLSTDYEHGAHR